MISLIKVYKLLKWCFSECFKFMKKKAEEKKWKQRYRVLAVCECNARGLYFKKNWWPYIMDSDIEIIFIGLVAVHTLFFTVTPPYSTYLLTMIHLCTCTQALYSMVFICMLLIWVLEKYEIGFTALQNYSNVEKRTPYQ